MLGTWWVWVAGGLAIGVLELIIPGYVFVGFALGAVSIGIWLGLGLPGSAALSTDPMLALVVFSLGSLLIWLALRRILGVREGQIKHIDRDINEG